MKVYKNREVSTVLVQRAERNEYKAIVLTVDSARLGRREADIKNKMVVLPMKNFEGLLSTEAVLASKSDIGWLRSITKLPILIKGILTSEDAIKAAEMGFDGIVVSNHGGRQLDYVPASISVLEEVVLAVGRKIPVLFDGGVRRGTDIFKALALGAQAVLVGRPIVFGLSVHGENGVRKVFRMLKDELELSMALAGCPSVKDITRNYVRTERDRKLQSML